MTPDVDADHELPILQRRVDQAGTVHRHAGIVAGDVQLSEITFGFGQSIEDGLFLRDIDSHRQHAFVCAGETVSRLLDQIFLDVRHDDVRSGLCKRGRNAEPDARSGTRDDRGLAGDVVHFQGPLLRSWMVYTLESVADHSVRTGA
jgi:hypothetical protein